MVKKDSVFLNGLVIGHAPKSKWEIQIGLGGFVVVVVILGEAQDLEEPFRLVAVCAPPQVKSRDHVKIPD